MDGWARMRSALAAALLSATAAGCGAPSAPAGLLAPLSQNGAPSVRVPTDEHLIYIAGTPAAVVSYKTGQLVGELDVGFAESVCADSAGNVFFTGGSGVVEYAHGGTTPIATLSLPGYSPASIGCAVDPTSGNLAVTFSTASGSGNVAIFPNEQGTPQVYQSGFDSQFCGYDAQGNLFVDGLNGSTLGLAELPTSGASFSPITLNGSIGGNPWSIFWDGAHMSIEGVTNSTATFSQLTIYGSAATIVNTVQLKGNPRHARGAAYYNGTLLMGFGAPTSGEIGFWRYPTERKPLRVLNHRNFGEKISQINGVAVSLDAQ